MPTTLLTLPEIPPPLSACFNNNRKRGRVKSKRYTAWINNVLCSRRGVGFEPLEGDVQAVYLYRRPDRRRRDLGNLEKATSDILMTLNVIKDDSQIIDLRLAWSESITDPVHIIITGEK